LTVPQLIEKPFIKASMREWVFGAVWAVRWVYRAVVRIEW